MKKRKNIAGIALTAALAALFILMLAKPEVVRESAAAALHDTALLVVPVLFPFAVLSSLLVGTKNFSKVAGRLMRPLCQLLRFSESAGSAILIGFLCGFPLGSAAVCRLYKNGQLDTSEAERLLALCHNTGPSFIIGYIGTVVFENVYFSVFLYLAEILIAVLIACRMAKNAPLPMAHPYTAEHDVIFPFSAAIRDSAAAMLTVTASVVWFRVIADVAASVLSPLALPIPRAVLLSLLECTSGIGAGATMGGTLGYALAGFSLGFSGLSVLTQAAAFAYEARLSMRKCYIAKVWQGFLLALTAALFSLRGAIPAAVRLTPVTVDFRLLTAIEVILLSLALIIPSIIDSIIRRRRRTAAKRKDCVPL